MTWRLYPSSAFAEYRALWDRTNGLQDDHPLLDSGFVSLLLKHFGSGATRLAVSTDAPGATLALVQPSGLGTWQTFQPSQAPVGLLVFPSRLGADLRMRELLHQLPGYAIVLSVLQQDPDFTSLAAEEGQPHVERLDYIQTARLTPSGSFDDYWASRGKNLTHNLSRQRRRLAKQGATLELVSDRDPATVAEAIGEYGRLESLSWKAEHGTAVSPDNPQGLFYRDILEYFCARGEGVIYRLLLDGKTVACDLCIERDGMLVILKTTYDERVSGFSLGLLLHESMFRRVFDEGRIRDIEFYGRVRDWHTKWTDETRRMYHLTLYRHAWMSRARRLIRAWASRGDHG
jgi:GNAT acetyltransferase-like protein